jgi:altered-inheritance-of-mitochondria protein 13
MLFWYLAGESKVEAGSEASNAGSRGTASLREDIEAVKRRVEKYSERRQLGSGSGSAVETSREAVVKCYRENAERPLDCWKQVEEFKQQVASIEAVCVSLSCSLLSMTPRTEIRRVVEVTHLFNSTVCCC